jgi:MFS family permease
MKDIKWLTYSQSIAILASSLVFPFYLLFIRGVGVNFSEFGIAYGIFTISSALVHKWIGKSSDKIGRKIFLLLNSWGMAIIFIIFPLVTNMSQVYILQAILGIFGAMQKTSEKAILADFTDKGNRGERIGVYHGWLSIFGGIAVMIGGYLVDLFTLEIIFYIGSIFFFISGLLSLKIKEK